jgi:RecJ-like exonuclease
MTNSSDRNASTKSQKVNPGDDAAPGTPGTGENVCPECKGSGKLGSAPCPACGGTGKVIEGVGGA